MQVEVSDIDRLAVEIHSRRWRRVGVDGVDGVGKSTLAKGLGEHLSLPVIGLDQRLHGKQGGFAAFINYTVLSAELKSEAFILEGVCLLDVLARARASVDGTVYVKRFRHGLWADEEECVFPDGIEVAIQRAHDHMELIREFEARQNGQPYVRGSGGALELTEELMRYHENFRPHEIAEIIFRREEV